MKPTFPALAAFALLAACGGSEQNEAANAGGKVEATANASASAAPANGQAPAANSAESIRTRQQHYKQIGGGMKGISDELKKDAPDLAKIQAHAATINGLAPQIYGWFPDGSGAAAGVKTGAREEIWSNPAEFKRRSEAFIQAAAQFHQTAQGGDLAAIRASLGPLGASCKGCHDEFRVED